MKLATINATHSLSKISLTLALALTLNPIISSVSSVLAQTNVKEQVEQSLAKYNQVIYVDSRNGNDLNGKGNSESPFKTITQALMIAQPKTLIRLAPGNYNSQTGEQFPLVIKQDVIIQGNLSSKGKNIIIEGSGFFVSPTAAGQNVTIVTTHQAGGIMGVTVTNLDHRGHGIWIESSNPVISNNSITRNNNTGVSVNGNAAPIIKHNYFFNNTGNGLLAYGTAQPIVENNEFHRSGFGVSGVKSSALVLVNNIFRDNRIGVMLEGNSQAILRQNQIINNQEVGLMTIAQANADLGTKNSPGQNIFRSNRGLDIKNSSANQVITAFGNQFSGHTKGNIDFDATTTPINLAVASNKLTNSSSDQSRQPLSSSVTETKPSGKIIIDITAPTTANSDSNQPLSSPITNNSSSVSHPNIPPLPTKLPPRETIRITANSTPPNPVSSGRGISSSNQLPAPPPVAEPYRKPEINTDIGSNPTNPRVEENRKSQNASRQLPYSREANPPSTIDFNRSNSNSTPKYSESNATRRTLADILVVAPGAADSNSSPSSNSNASSYHDNSQFLQYKIVVEAQNNYQESQIRSLYPEAFRTTYNGRSMLQVGVFSTRENAQQVIQSLQGVGLNPLVIH